MSREALFGFRPYEVLSNKFSTAEAGLMSGVPPALQRVWRRRGHLPSQTGRTHYNIMDVMTMALVHCLTPGSITEAHEEAAKLINPLLLRVFYDERPSFHFQEGVSQKEFEERYDAVRQEMLLDPRDDMPDLMVSFYDAPFIPFEESMLSDTYKSPVFRILSLHRLAIKIRRGTDRALFSVQIDR